MAKKESADATATVADYSEGNDGSKEIEVKYSYEYQVLESQEELQREFSIADLISLANQRLKSTANSGARQKAIAPYAQDPNSPAAVRSRMIKDAMKLGKDEATATAFVDSLLS